MTARKWWVRGAMVLVALVVLLAAVVVTGLQLADRKMQRNIDVKVSGFTLRTDAAAVDRGRYLFASRGCVDCHGAQAGGRTFVDDGAMKVVGPNISPGPGSVVGGYTPQDWERSIRHGVNPLGRPLLIMPSEDYNRFTNDDLASLVAYLRSIPPATGGPAVIQLPLPVRALYGFGLIPDAASRIDHTLPPSTPVAEGVSIAHGAYVANMCLGCHGAQMAGGKIAGGPPDWPPAADLRPSSQAMAAYPDAESLIRLFKTGKRMDGTAVKVMPFESLREMSETDMRALHMYLKTVPAAPRS